MALTCTRQGGRQQTSPEKASLTDLRSKLQRRHTRTRIPPPAPLSNHAMELRSWAWRLLLLVLVHRLARVNEVE